MMTMRLASALAAWLTPAVVLASDNAHHDAGHDGVPWATLLFSSINAGLFVFILARYAWPAIRNWIAERRATIVQTLAEAERAKREAQELKQEWERRVAGFQAELDAMRQRARAEIAREREQMLAAAQRTAENIRRDADRAAEQEQRAAQAQLREEIARRALALAAERARQQLTPADHDRFISDFLQQVRS
jgi:F-type H+-transporting ATPase subunit b